MSRLLLSVAALLILPPLGLIAAPADPRPEAPSPETCADRLWVITNFILDHHVTPPTRQEMLLAALEALPRTDSTPPPGKLARKLSEVTTPAQFDSILKATWPKEANSNELQQAMMQRLLERVPGQPRLIPLSEYRVMEQVAQNRYVGTGISVRVHPQEKLVQVITTFPDSPARHAGMKANDLIEAVDGKDVHGKPLQEVVDLLRGGEGEPVSVVVRQPDSKEKRSLKIVRAVVPFERLLGYRRRDGASWTYRVDPSLPLAYVRIQSLSSSALQELRQIERHVQAEGCQALVLDMRFLTDGDLTIASLVADSLLDGGVMFRVRNAAYQVKDYEADRNVLFRGWPVVVLVSEFTRSTAANLIVAALKDTGRAVLVGTSTRSNGYITEFEQLPEGLGVVPLATGIALRATKSATPLMGGIEPDHKVPLEEARQRGVIAWHDEEQRSETARPKVAPPQDPQLARALELLQADLKKRESKE